MKSKVTRIAVYSFEDHIDVVVDRDNDLFNRYENVTNRTIHRLCDLTYQDDIKTGCNSLLGQISVFLRPIRV